MSLGFFLNLSKSVLAEIKNLKGVSVQVHSRKQNPTPMVQEKRSYQQDYFQGCGPGSGDQPGMLNPQSLATEERNNVIRAQWELETWRRNYQQSNKQERPSHCQRLSMKAEEEGEYPVSSILPCSQLLLESPLAEPREKLVAQGSGWCCLCC